MSHLRFVHLSDIHFGQNRNGSIVFHHDVRAELLNDCKVVRGRLGDAHGVIITGDVAFAGKKKEYEEASAWLAQLTEAVGCKKTDVKVIPGNHDVDVDAIGYSTKLAHENLRGLSADKIQEVLDEIAAGDEDGNPLLPKLKAYREFAAGYGCDFESIGKPVWIHPILLRDKCRLSFLGLNSVQVSDKSDNKRQGTMVLGKRQYIIPREPDVEYVVLIHHPLHWLKDSVEAKQFLNSRAKIIMLGHEHNASIEKIAGETDDERLIISAGATNPPESDFKYTYNWLEFSHREIGDAQKLVVRVHPSVWVREQTKFAPDRERLNGVESKEFQLNCPMFRKSEVLEAKVTEKTLEKTETQNLANEIGMITSEDERFARLRYFFWRFLDWRQRLSVLSDLDILPRTADRPVPQTLERLALDTARTQRKLAALWNATMQRVPEGEREPNPFVVGKE